MILRSAFGFLFAVSIALAQGSTGTISGTVTDPDKNAVFGATVQAKNTVTGKVYKTETSRTGSFALSQLPAGTYELLVPPLGFTFFAYTKKDLVVAAGQTVRHDVRLEWPANLGTIGDDTFLLIKNRYAGLKGRTPRMPNGKPDFSGVWNGAADVTPEEASTLPWVKEVMKERLENNFKDLPSAHCLPGEAHPNSPFPYKFVQTSTLLLQLSEDEGGIRQVYLDGRAHPKDPDPTWKGHSIGKWEGDTLVVDTIGFNDKSWLQDGLPHTEKLHIIERYRRPDLANLTIDVTIEDPGTFTKPWNLHMNWTLAPGEDLIEYVCAENNQYSSHAVGK